MIVTSVEQLEELQVAAKGRLKSQFKKGQMKINTIRVGGRERKERFHALMWTPIIFIHSDKTRTQETKEKSN